MTGFSEFCAFLNVTLDERMKLAQFLATLRHAATMRLGTPPLPDSNGMAVVECHHGIPPQYACDTCDRAPAIAGVPVDAPTVREFTNELENRIRITIEGPTSTSENVLTPMEVRELRGALDEHARGVQEVPRG
jgi:hypothetical protein